MLDELLAANNLIMTILLSYISFHCFKKNAQAPEFLDAFSGKSTELFEILTEGGNLLADIGDLLDQEVPTGPVQSAGGANPMEAILGLLMSRATMPREHGSETNEERPVHEREQPETSEQIQGRGESP